MKGIAGHPLIWVGLALVIILLAGNKLVGIANIIQASIRTQASFVGMTPFPVGTIYGGCECGQANRYGYCEPRHPDYHSDTNSCWIKCPSVSCAYGSGGCIIEIWKGNYESWFKRENLNVNQIGYVPNGYVFELYQCDDPPVTTTIYTCPSGTTPCSSSEKGIQKCKDSHIVKCDYYSGLYCWTDYGDCKVVGMSCSNGNCIKGTTTTTPPQIGCEDWCDDGTTPTEFCHLERCIQCSFCKDIPQGQCTYQGKTYLSGEVVSVDCNLGYWYECGYDGTIHTVTKQGNPTKFSQICPKTKCRIQSESCGITASCCEGLVCEPPVGGICQVPGYQCLAEGRNCELGSTPCCTGLKCEPYLTWYRCQKPIEEQCGTFDLLCKLKVWLGRNWWIYIGIGLVLLLLAWMFIPILPLVARRLLKV